MRLHRIEIANLNSLYGEHTIDLDESLGGASLFLIQGPTGAGKSTILDAVSLALFGTTPRLGALAGKELAAELMSRGAGASRVAVEFSVWRPEGRARYRATWKVHRARERADGELQATTRGIERLDAPGLAISSTKQKDYDPAFGEVLQDFTPADFQRSMLLAQGRFDAMLHAKPKERAAILERLTDTGVYQQLGERAARLGRAWNAQLARLIARRDGVAGVEPAKVAEAERAAAEETEGLRTLEAARGRLVEALGWLARVEQLDAARARAEEAQAAAASVWEAVQADREALEAQEALRPAFERADDFDRAEAELARDRGLLQEAEQAVPGAAARVLRAEASEAETQAAWERGAQTLEALRGPATALQDVQLAAKSAEAEAGVAVREADKLAGEAVALSKRVDQQVQRVREAEIAAGQTAEALRALVGEEAPGAALEGARARAGDAVVRRGRLRVARDAALQAASASAKELTARSDQAGLEQRAAVLVEAAAQGERAVEAARVEVEAASRVAAPLERIAALAERRAALEPGEACPLCGSPEHPFVHDAGARARAEAVERELTEARAGLVAAQRASQEAETNRNLAARALAGAEAEVRAGAQRMAELGVAAADAQALARRAAEEAGVGEIAPTALDAALAEAEARADADAQRLAAVERAVSESQAAIHAAEVERAALGPLRDAREAADRRAEEARATSARKQERAVEVRAEALRADADFAERWARAGRALPVPTSAAEAIGQLEFDANRLARALDLARRTASEARVGASEVAGRAKAAQGVVERSALRVEAARGALAEALASHGLAELDALRDRRLSETDVRAARERVRAAENGLVAARAGAEAATTAWAAHLDARPGDLPAEPDPAALRELMAETDAAIDAGRARLEDARVVLAEAARAGEARERAQAELDAAQERARVWLRLHDLIGVGDGSRFKEFAQALNLDQLLWRANRHLERLAERYRLRPLLDDKGLPTLDFVVEDQYRLGSTRSPKNLSGGESFLVSLALALGLSDLRTSRMPIETLLLDEGFGTLDPVTLDVAMNALAQLQADGRRVGIISHVVGLHERIPARIVVEPVGEGRSRVRVGG